MFSHRALHRLRNVGLGLIALAIVTSLSFGFSHGWQMVLDGETVMPALARTLGLLTPFLLGCGAVGIAQSTLWRRCSLLQDRISSELVAARQRLGDEHERVKQLAVLEKDARHMFGAKALYAIEARVAALQL